MGNPQLMNRGWQGKLDATGMTGRQNPVFSCHGCCERKQRSSSEALGRLALLHHVDVDRMIGSRDFKRQNISLAKLPLHHWFANMPGGLRYILACPAWHRLRVRAPTPRFRAAAPTCGGICPRASHAALPDFPAPPRGRLRARRSCRHCRPCACDAR